MFLSKLENFEDKLLLLDGLLGLLFVLGLELLDLFAKSKSFLLYSEDLVVERGGFCLEEGLLFT